MQGPGPDQPRAWALGRGVLGPSPGQFRANQCTSRRVVAAFRHQPAFDAMMQGIILQGMSDMAPIKRREHAYMACGILSKYLHFKLNRKLSSFGAAREPHGAVHILSESEWAHSALLQCCQAMSARLMGLKSASLLGPDSGARQESITKWLLSMQICRH